MRQVISALLAKFHDFTGAHSITRIPWYTREASFAVCVANALEIWCLFRRNMSFVHDTAQSHVQCSEAPQDEKVYTNKNNHHGHAHTFQIPSPDDLEYEEASHSD